MPASPIYAFRHHRVHSWDPQNPVVTAASVQSEEVPHWLRRAGGFSWRFLVTVATVALIVYGALQVGLVLIAMFFALVITSVLEPAVQWLSRWIPRAVATVISLVFSFLFFAGLLTYVVASVTTQATKLAEQFNHGINGILDWLEHGPLPFTITTDDLNHWIREGQSWLQSHAGDLAGTVLSQAGTIGETIAVIALAIFSTIFFLISGPKMWVWFLNQLPYHSRGRVHEAAGAAWYTFSGYARGTVIIAVIDGILAFILLVLVGVPLSAPLAVLVFIGAFIPLVGAPGSMIVAAVVALAANGPIAGLIVMIGIALIGQLEGHVLQPLIMGRQVSLHPLVVAVGVTGGTFLGGLFGAIVAIPLIAVVWTVFSRLRVVDEPMTDPLPSVKEIVKPALPPEDDSEGPLAKVTRHRWWRFWQRHRTSEY